MKTIRILIVEDDPVLLAGLTEEYRRIFESKAYATQVVAAADVANARRMAKEGRSRPFDLVSLDVNLGDSALTGMDVLDTLNRFRSAWMVALLTGVETDDSLDRTLGNKKAEEIRKQLRRDAFSRFPAERLLVVEKPSSRMTAADARRLLTNRMEQIALVYEEVGLLRYVFRPIEVTSLERVPAPKGGPKGRKFIETTALHWQIRFDCGELRTLPNMAGFRTLHYLLSRDREDSVTPEEALSIEPKKEKTGGMAEGDPLAAWFKAQGIEWDRLSTEDQDKLIRAALSLKLERYCQLREYQDEDDLSAIEEEELARVTAEFGPLADAAESAYLRMRPADAEAVDEPPTAAEMTQNDLHVGGDGYDKLGTNRRGKDSPAAALFRARMKRVKDCLRENGFAAFATHLEDYLMSTGANWSYNPPEGVEWTT
jgi:CheY-like chemotaxis protein